MRIFATTALAAAVSVAAAQNTLTLDLVAPSSAEIQADYDTYLGADSALAGPSLTGSITIEVDDLDVPTTFTLHDFTFDVSPPGDADTTGSIDAGQFLGSGTFTLDLDGVMLPAGTPPINADGIPSEGKGGIFQFSNVPVRLLGNASAIYDFIGLGPVTIDPPGPALDTFGNANAIITDIFYSFDGQTVTFHALLILDEFTVPWETALVETHLNLAADITAEFTFNPNLLPPCSRVDIAEPCGLLDLSDVLAFVTGFGSQNPLADIDGNGLFDLSDVLGFVTAFQSAACNQAPPPGYYYSCYTYGGGMAAIEFDRGNPTYALGRHGTLTAGIAVSGACLMLGFTAYRRRHP
ncbi:MAG: hypothetical protein H6810_04900 [Phycisphaeraceae bacterium]|nr:MAG: hypothetical protein H6810_04900 [Phycisphaeraceae bacterium]